MKTNLILCLLMTSGLTASAQQQPLFSQYNFNRLVINPAYAGDGGALQLTGAFRMQWINIEGAPNTQTLTIDAPIQRDRVGLGLIIQHDNIGIRNQVDAYSIYSYRIPLGNERIISAGLQGGISYIKDDFSKINADGSDPQLPQALRTDWAPNFGAGLYFTSSKFFTGISIPYLLEYELSETVRQRRHYLLNTGALFTLSPLMKLKSSFLLRVSEGSWQIDVNSSFLFREVLWMGLSYRHFESIDFLVQLRCTNQLQLGYSYDFLINDLSKTSPGSHEVMFIYRFLYSRSEIISPRYF